MNYQDIDFNLDFGNFDPEAIQIDETINAVFIVDTSGSIVDYVKELNAAFNDFTETMQKSHIAPKLFVSIVEFSDVVRVASGFQPISSIPKMNFGKKLGGATKLYDGVLSGVKNALDYRSNLENSGIETKTLIFVITDGGDNASQNPPHVVKMLFDQLRADERSAFTFTSILFGVGNAQEFEAAYRDMGIDHLARIGTSGAEIKKMIGFISQSISSVSAGKGAIVPTF